MNFLTSLTGKQQDLPLLKPKANGVTETSVPASSGMRCRMSITPDQAAAWLENNTHNRPLRQCRVAKYARAMERGLWRYNYQPIIVSRDGLILDGQHRLWACVESNAVFESDVVFGADSAIMDSIDMNATRSSGDQAHLGGVKNANVAASAALLILMFEDGNIDSVRNTKLYPTNQEVISRASDPAIQASIRVAMPSKHICRRLGASTFCHYVFHRQNAELADRFFAELASGAMLAEDNPVFQLRKRLEENNRSRSKLPQDVIIALFFKAWQKYRANKRMKVLSWRSTGPSPEPFPEI